MKKFEYANVTFVPEPFCMTLTCTQATMMQALLSELVQQFPKLQFEVNYKKASGDYVFGGTRKAFGDGWLAYFYVIDRLGNSGWEPFNTQLGGSSVDFRLEYEG
jgi:hypothetical protein